MTATNHPTTPTPPTLNIAQFHATVLATPGIVSTERAVRTKRFTRPFAVDTAQGAGMCLGVTGEHQVIVRLHTDAPHAEYDYPADAVFFAGTRDSLSALGVRAQTCWFVVLTDLSPTRGTVMSAIPGGVGRTPAELAAWMDGQPTRAVKIVFGAAPTVGTRLYR